MGDFKRVYKTDLTDRQLMDFWRLVQASGRDREVAYCLPPMDGKGFVRWMRQDDVHPWGVLYKGVPVGFYFLTDKQGKSAQVHFCTLPVGVRRVRLGGHQISLVRAMGMYATASALWERNQSGGFVLDTLIGVTPLCNEKAVKYAHMLGAQDCGIVPDMCWYHDTGENVPGLLTVYTRNTVPEEAARL